MANDIVTGKLKTKISRLRSQIEKKSGKSVDQLRLERDKRLNDTIRLKVPDRVPVTIQTGVFACRYAGIPLSAMYYDPVAYWEACIKTIVDFQPDTGGMAAIGTSGLINELLNPLTSRWPGGNLAPDVPYQFVEGEYMKEDEYDLFLSDPSDFVLRYYLPRTYGTFKPLTGLPPLRNLAGGFFFGILSVLGQPEFRELGEKLSQAAAEQARLNKLNMALAKLEAGLGYPSQFGPMGRGMGIGGAPFDAVSDFLRGMRGAMLDMYRCPDKLLKACEKIQEWRFAEAAPAVLDEQGNPPRLFMALHRGSDGFMSKKQFEKFYWPGLKKAILKTIDLGYIAAPFFEGVWDDRLEYLLDLPKGKVIFWVERTDVFRAKEILGDRMCIQGGVPPTILQAGSPQDVEEHCKKLVKVVGKNGGLIVGPGSAMDYARPENVKAMIDTVKKYGLY
jgi:uroporphyrinogen-III decarboxylase